MRVFSQRRAWLGLAFVSTFACGVTRRDAPPSAAVGGAAAGASAAQAGAGSSFGSSSGGQGATAQTGAGQAGSAAVGASAAGAAGSTDVSAAAGAGGASQSGCGVAALDGLQVHSASNSPGNWDALGYPPYALDGCTLVYVTAAEGTDQGALVLRDLTTGSELVLDAADANPRRPAVAGEVVAWESDGTAGSRVNVRYSGGPTLFETSFERAGEPRVTEDALVFTAFVGTGVSGDTDVDLYDVMKRVLTPIATGPGQQRFADVSATHVAVTDFSEDPDGYFNESGSIADILVIERDTLSVTSRAAPGKQAFPLLGDGGVVAYLAWGAVHPEPKFSQFMLEVGNIDEPVSADINVKGGDAQVSTNPAYVRPSLHGSYLDYIDDVAGAPQLFRASLDEPTPPVAIAIAGASRLLGPVAADTLTLVAKPLQGATVGLVAVAR